MNWRIIAAGGLVALAAAVVLVLVLGGDEDAPPPEPAETQIPLDEAARAPQTRAPDPADAVAIPESPYLVIPNELVVMLAEGATLDAFRAVVESLPVSVVGFVEEFRVVQVEVPAERREEIKARLEADPLVRGVARQVLFAPLVTFNDPVFHNEERWDDWQFRAIGAEAAWAVTRGDPGTVIAVIDDGVLFDHEELTGKIVHPISIFSGTAEHEIDDVLGQHGTPVSIMAVGRGDNGVGTSGVCPECSLMPIQARFASGMFDAIAYAVEVGADVINISMGPDSREDVDALAARFHDPVSRAEAMIEAMTSALDWVFYYDEALSYAEAYGVTVVASAGNEGSPGAFQPFCLHPVTLCVAAAELRIGGAVLVPSLFSNYGFMTDVSAPGAEIYSGTGAPGGQGYEWTSGTSFSAPIVAGLAGLIRSANPELDAAQIRHVIIASGRVSGAIADSEVVLYPPATAVEAERRAYGRALARLLGLDESLAFDAYGYQLLAYLAPLDDNPVWLRPQAVPPGPAGLFASDGAPPPDPEIPVCVGEEWDSDEAFFAALGSDDCARSMGPFIDAPAALALAAEGGASARFHVLTDELYDRAFVIDPDELAGLAHLIGFEGSYAGGEGLGEGFVLRARSVRNRLVVTRAEPPAGEYEEWFAPLGEDRFEHHAVLDGVDYGQGLVTLAREGDRLVVRNFLRGEEVFYDALP